MNGLAGTLGERVTFERRGPERDALGSAEGDWAVEATVWAAVVPDGVGAETAGEAASGMPRLRVTIRRRAVLLEHRLVWRGRRFGVREIVEDPRAPDRIVLRVEEMR